MNRKSKFVTIGLLALSIASCSSNKTKERRRVDDYQNNPNYYVDNGMGYQHGGISPFWIYWMYGMNDYGRVIYYPTYVHQSYYGTYHSTSMGRSSYIGRSGIRAKTYMSATRSSVSRGGFGHSGGGHSSGS